ncbi:hypothetical protein OEZ71_18720 [Defluviimonas sp. WL0050]|uniref:Uncharacterized protein n=1 Tax=Albidovulum litorale TaxID=2984134 RepID=A0ABT2ZT53_9RHOB|nr:hypothetical protein [Defluviimonas sp. WL0050]MCV2874335.1 hypothetical protein [Defluviimonas sp. WL0050]
MGLARRSVFTGAIGCLVSPAFARETPLKIVEICLEATHHPVKTQIGLACLATIGVDNAVELAKAQMSGCGSLSSLRQKWREDFKKGQIQAVDEWQLARTEIAVLAVGAALRSGLLNSEMVANGWRLNRSS